MRVWLVTIGAPARMSAMSQLVPPISSEIDIELFRLEPRRACCRSTPAARPESSSDTGRCMTDSALVMPPRDCMTCSFERKPIVAKLPAQPRDIVADRPMQIGVERRHHGPLVLAERRIDLARERYVKVGTQLTDDVACALLVRRIAEREQVTDGDRGYALRSELCDRGAHRILVQRRDDRRRPPRPARSTPQRRRRGARNAGRLGLEQQIVHSRSLVAADLQGILEPVGGEDAGHRAFALDQRIDRDRAAVNEAIDLPGMQIRTPPARARRPVRTPAIGSDGRGWHLGVLRRRPSSRSSTTSVKVPPMSTPISIMTRLVRAASRADIGTGLIGGRTCGNGMLSSSTERCAAMISLTMARHMRPWHRPMPARVQSFIAFVRRAPRRDAGRDLLRGDLLAAADRRWHRREIPTGPDAGRNSTFSMSAKRPRRARRRLHGKPPALGLARATARPHARQPKVRRSALPPARLRSRRCR